MRIIYKTPEGTVSVIAPSQEWTGSMEELAKKVVAKGDKFKIVEDDVLPNDRDFRNAWEWDFSDFDGYGENEG